MESVKHENGSGSSEEEEEDKYEPDLDLEKDLPLGKVALKECTRYCKRLMTFLYFAFCNLDSTYIK